MINGWDKMVHEVTVIKNGIQLVWQIAVQIVMDGVICHSYGAGFKHLVIVTNNIYK